jgi:hypothetical protein
MIYEIVTDFIKKGNTIITSPAGNGCTTLALYLAAQILVKNDSRILYYNPSADINIDYVTPLSNPAYKDIFFHQESLKTFVDFLEYSEYDFDYLFIDPADTLLVNSKILPLILKLFKGKIVAVSQIRQDPTLGGQVYSTIEKLNVFDYSIWIRNVTENEELFKSRYLDVYDRRRSGNKYVRRYVVKFDSKTGNIME